MRYIALLLRALRRIPRTFSAWNDSMRLRLSLFINCVEYGSIHSNGLPYICVAPSGRLRIGKNLTMSNGLRFNPIGFPQPCMLYVGVDARLTIGDNVGMSQSAIICHKEIEIQSNVKIGGGGKSLRHRFSFA